MTASTAASWAVRGLHDRLLGGHVLQDGLGVVLVLVGAEGVHDGRLGGVGLRLGSACSSKSIGSDDAAGSSCDDRLGLDDRFHGGLDEQNRVGLLGRVRLYDGLGGVVRLPSATATGPRAAP